MTTYILSIQDPDDINTIAEQYFSDTPFQTFNKGDIIDPSFWEGRGLIEQDKVLQVINIEHHIWKSEAGILTDGIMVYTKKVQDNNELRRSQ